MEDGWMVGGSFFGSIISGTLLGYFADRWLDTAPWLVVIGAALGAYSGFMRLYAHAKEAGDDRSWAPWRYR
jgi:ATP synthase protein I